MGKYEKFSFIQLQDDPSIDPDDPGVLYAKACCFLLGDGGVEEANQDVCIKLLGKAAELGNEEAKKELKSLTSAESNAPDASEQEDYSKKGFLELDKLAKAGDLQAVKEGYKQCDKYGLGEEEKEKYLELGINAIKNTKQGSDDLCREVSEMAGKFYKKRKKAEESRECYELARKFGSNKARLALLDLDPDQDMEEICGEELMEMGSPVDWFKYGVWCERKHKPVKYILGIFQKVFFEAGHPIVRAKAEGKIDFYKKELSSTGSKENYD